ncbi:MAG: FecR domain-containing protein [Enterocloster asparagiformis]|nr:FecR domain-containing protein [Enterocloster asparagiformis]
MIKNRKKGAVRILAAVSALLIAVPGLLSSAAQETAQASSIRLTALEGEVSVAGQGGKALAAFENMRILSGYSLETGKESYAGFVLDDVKAAKLDALSTAEVRKKDKKLELLLSSGSVFCDIKEPLKSDETMNIRTSTMITGIRGTVLYVKVTDQNTSTVFVLEGSVAMRGINPETGRTAEVLVGTGQKGVAVTGIQGSGPGEAPVRAYVEAFSKEEIDGYVLMQVAADGDLARRLEAAGWDVSWMRDNAARRLKEDQLRASQLLEQIARLENDGEKKVFDQIYGGDDSDSGSGKASARRKVVMTMPVTAREIADQLENADVTVNCPAGEPEGYVLPLDCDMTVPAGGSLEIGPRVIAQVGEGVNLRVDGTMRTAEDFYNFGTIINTSAHTLDVGGDFGTYGILNNTGKIRVAEGMTGEGGAVSNTGKGSVAVQGELNLAGTRLDLGGGDITVGGALVLLADREEQTILGDNLEVSGPLVLRDGAFQIKGGVYRNGAEVEDRLEMSGGTLFSGDAECAIREGETAATQIRLSGGNVYAQSGARAAVVMDGGELTVQANVLRVEDISSTAFVVGTGTLNLPGHAGLSIENLEEDQMEAVEGADGWELGVFSGGAMRNVAGRKREGENGLSDNALANPLPASPPEAERETEQETELPPETGGAQESQPSQEPGGTQEFQPPQGSGGAEDAQPPQGTGGLQDSQPPQNPASPQPPETETAGGQPPQTGTGGAHPMIPGHGGGQDTPTFPDILPASPSNAG